MTLPFNDLTDDAFLTLIAENQTLITHPQPQPTTTTFPATTTTRHSNTDPLLDLDPDVNFYN